jgi:hypothetical protein
MSNKPSALAETNHRSDGPSQRDAGLIPQIGPIEAIRRHWLIALLPIVLFVGGGIVVARERAPMYTAETRMVVGGLDLSAPGALSGLATATQSLAALYARAVSATQVVAEAADRVGVSPEYVRARVASVPIQDSPVFRIVSESEDPQVAVRLANETSAALTRYADRLNREAPQRNQERLYENYLQASERYQEAIAARDRARLRFQERRTQENQRRLLTARTEAAAARLRMQALENSYLASAGGRTAVASLDRLAPATAASSDRMSRIQLFGFVGLLAGGLAGAALATLRANRIVRRRFAP